MDNLGHDRRVHIHVGNEVVNIHEDLLKDLDYSPFIRTMGFRFLSTDEKGEDHFQGHPDANWEYSAISCWLYQKMLPGRADLEKPGLMGNIPMEWDEGDESHVSMAIALWNFAHSGGRHWYGLGDAMMTIIFNHYRHHRKAPSQAHVRQVFEAKTRPTHYGLKHLFTKLHLKFGDSTNYNSINHDETDPWPNEFLCNLVYMLMELKEYEQETKNSVVALREYHDHRKENAPCGCRETGKDEYNIV